MANVADIKNKILVHMVDMNLENMTIEELSAYTDVLRRVSDISEKPYMETLVDAMHKGFCADKTDGTETTGLALGLAGGGFGV